MFYLCMLLSMRGYLFALLIFIPLASFSENSTSITDIVRLPVFCDVAGSYKGTYTNGTWSVLIDPYTGIASVHVQSSGNDTFGDGSVHRYKDTVLFSLDLPNGAAWRGKFVLSKNDMPTVSGKFLSFDTDGKFNAIRETNSSTICEVSVH